MLPRPAQVAYQPVADRIGRKEHDGLVWRPAARGASGGLSHCHDNSYVEPREFTCEFRQPFNAVLTEAIFDDDVSTLNVAKLTQALLKPRQFGRIVHRCAGENPSNARGILHLCGYRLLC